MIDEGSGSPYGEIRRRRGRHRAPREKGKWLKAALYVGIAACLLASVLLVTGGGRVAGVEVSSLMLSAGDTAGDAAHEGNIFEDSLIDPRLILGTELPVIYGIDLEEVNPRGSESAAGINFDVIPEDIRMEILKFSGDAQEPFYVGGDGPQILIYHTHTREAYFEADKGVYNVGEYQTTDESRSVVAVGEALKKALEGYGFTVLHDTTDHVPPKQSTAYSRSVKTMLKYQQQYPTLRVFIDLHRDAYGKGYPPPEAGQKDYVTVDGEKCARVMCVVGTGENYKGSDKPNYESNYKLAQALTNGLQDICDGFTRPIRVKPGQYNQQVSDMCLLIEVGHNANTLDQALNAAPHIAQALAQAIRQSGP